MEANYRKDAMRKAIRRQMRQMDSSVRKEIDSVICRKTILLPEFTSANTVFCFVGVDWEIDTYALINAALHSNKRVVVPRCTGPGIMEARVIRSLHDLRPGAYSIPEPHDRCPVCAACEIDFAVVPCVSCDTACMRLGQGGGFYDRFMENTSFFTAALCRSAGLAEKIPVDPWDQPVNCVVTETQIYRR